jgi:hypothetical protein
MKIENRSFSGRLFSRGTRYCVITFDLVYLVLFGFVVVGVVFEE